jgi:hypothetical protein
VFKPAHALRAQARLLLLIEKEFLPERIFVWAVALVFKKPKQNEWHIRFKCLKV